MSALALAFETWLADQARQGRLRRASSQAVYRTMWGALLVWCGQQRPALRRLQALDSAALAGYIQSRSGAVRGNASLTPRYQWRLLSLVLRVQAHAAGQARWHRVRSTAAALHTSRPALRQADPAPPPDHLSPAHTQAVLLHLARQAALAGPADTATTRGWQAWRDAAAVALQLGAGLGPGDVRALRLADVLPPPAAARRLLSTDTACPDQPADTRSPPATPATVLQVPASGSARAHAAPVPGWAVQHLAQWLALRRHLQIPGDWLLPATRTGKPWGKVAHYNAVRQLMADAGLPGALRGGTFLLRHTFALRQLQLGHAPDTVAAWLGVSDPEVMRRYQRVGALPPAGA